jgi:hypothetical protein
MLGLFSRPDLDYEFSKRIRIKMAFSEDPYAIQLFRIERGWL